MKLNLRTASGGKVVGAVLAMGLVIAAFAGCGGGSGSEDTSSSKIEPTVTAGEAKGDIPTLNWALPAGEPPTLDPAQAVSFSSAVVVSNLCDSLVRMNPDTTPKPGAATFKRVNPTTFVFTLKPGIKFWNGQEATAEDMLFSLERSADPTSIGSATYENVRSMKITGPDQVTVKLTKPDARFELKLGATLYTALLEKSYTEAAGDELGTAEGGLMCSGPFELADWKQGQEIVLTRNDSYWDPAYKAHAKNVSLKFLTDTTALVQGLATGELEGAYGIPPAVIPKLSGTDNGSLYYGDSLEWLAVQVATPDSVMNDADLSRALLLSIDREAVAKAIYHESANPNYTMVGTNIWPPEGEEPWKDAYPAFVEKNAHNPEEAKKLVEASDYNGQPIVMAIKAGDETMSQSAQLIQQEAAQIGLNLKIRSVQPTQFETMSYTPDARAGIDLFLTQTFDVVKNPLVTAAVVLLPGAFFNYTDFDNPKVTSLFETARETLDAQKRSELLVEAQDIYEGGPQVHEQAILTLYTITYQNDGLAGAITNGTWLWTPSLATIGAAS